jgi:hypothetical protein
MEAFDVRLAKILDYVHHYLPDHRYCVVFHRVGQEWQFMVTGDPSFASNSRSIHIFCQVEGKDFEALPTLLLTTVKDRVEKYIADAVSEVEKKRVELGKAREELDKRLRADLDYLSIGKSFLKD